MSPNKESYGTIQQEVDAAEQGWNEEPSASQEHAAAAITVTQKFDLGAELQRLLSLAFPSVAVQFNMYMVFPQAASEGTLTFECPDGDK